MAETDIFSNSFTATKTISADGAVVTWATSGRSSLVPMVMTSLTVTYQRALNPLYPVNVDSDNTRRQLVISGVPTGTFGCAAIITPDSGDLAAFLQACGAACSTDLPNITVRPFDASQCSAGLSFVLYGVQLAGFTVSQQGGTMALVNMNPTFQFTRMTFIS